MFVCSCIKTFEVNDIMTSYNVWKKHFKFLEIFSEVLFHNFKFSNKFAGSSTHVNSEIIWVSKISASEMSFLSLSLSRLYFPLLESTKLLFENYCIQSFLSFLTNISKYKEIFIHMFQRTNPNSFYTEKSSRKFFLALKPLSGQYLLV